MFNLQLGSFQFGQGEEFSSLGNVFNLQPMPNSDPGWPEFSSLGNVFNLQLRSGLAAAVVEFSSLGNVFNLQHDGLCALNAS